MDGLISGGGGGGQSGILRYIVLLYSGSGISIKTVFTCKYNRLCVRICVHSPCGTSSSSSCFY